MNNKYMTILSRDEFIKLYRFGAININRNFLLKKDSNIENNLIEIFKNLSYNESSDYLIITINENNYNQNYKEIIYNLKLQNILRVEVLSEKAERFYRTKVNYKVTYHLTSYSNIFPTIENYQELKDMNQGVDILFEQFSINNREEIEKKLGKNFQDRFLKKYEEDKNYLKCKYESFFFDLLFYLREIKFTKKDVGFVYDMMILSLLKDRNEKTLKKFESGDLSLNASPTYKKLDSNKQNNIFEYISFILLSNDKNIQKFLGQVEKQNLIVGSIFLKIKSLLEDKEDNPNYWNDIVNIVNICPIEYKKELGIALYFIGLIFGYRGLYDNYYDFLEEKRKEEELNIIPSDDKDIESLQEKVNELQFEKNAKVKELEETKSTLKKAKNISDKEKNQAEKKAKDELKKLQKEKDSMIEELEKAKNVSDEEKIEAEEKAKAELEKLQQEKDFKIEELKKAKKVSDKEKIQAEKKAKEELEKLQKEKDSKIEELKKAKKVSDKEKIQAEEKAKDELEKLQKEKDSKIEELERANATLQSEKNAKNIEIEEPKKAKVTIQELIKIEPKKETIDDILKEITEIEELQQIVKELNSKSTAKTVGGLKKAIKKACSTDDKIARLKILISQKENSGLFV